MSTTNHGTRLYRVRFLSSLSSLSPVRFEEENVYFSDDFGFDRFSGLVLVVVVLKREGTG